MDRQTIDWSGNRPLAPTSVDSHGYLPWRAPPEDGHWIPAVPRSQIPTANPKVRNSRSVENPIYPKGENWGHRSWRLRKRNEARREWTCDWQSPQEGSASGRAEVSQIFPTTTRATTSTLFWYHAGISVNRTGNGRHD